MNKNKKIACVTLCLLYSCNLFSMSCLRRMFQTRPTKVAPKNTYETSDGVGDSLELLERTNPLCPPVESSLCAQNLFNKLDAILDYPTFAKHVREPWNQIVAEQQNPEMMIRSLHAWGNLVLAFSAVRQKDSYTVKSIKRLNRELEMIRTFYLFARNVEQLQKNDGITDHIKERYMNYLDMCQREKFFTGVGDVTLAREFLLDSQKDLRRFEKLNLLLEEENSEGNCGSQNSVLRHTRGFFASIAEGDEEKS